MAGAAALYTPAVLGLATGLAALPLDDGLPLRAEARSPACGSTLTLGLAVGVDGLIARVGLAASACAIGQAAAAIFANAAPGRDLAAVDAARAEIAAWLAAGGAAPVPSWPGLAAIAAAAGFPGRHGAILLAWHAASAALTPAGLPTAVAHR